jgi:thioredoxin-dependent peroxiredoxin
VNGKELRKFDAAYFTASCDPADGKKGNINFAKSLKLDYPILSDPTKKTAKAYGVVTTLRPFPHRWTFYIGKDGKILKIDKKVKAGQDGANAAKTLKALGIGAN